MDVADDHNGSDDDGDVADVTIEAPCSIRTIVGSLGLFGVNQNDNPRAKAEVKRAMLPTP